MAFRINITSALQDRMLWRRFHALTMANRHRFCANLSLIRRRAREIDLARGCYVECGTWRGGISFAVMQLDIGIREFRFFDSFEGLPHATIEDGARALADQATGRLWHDNNKADAAEFSANLKRYGRPGQSLFVSKGWFEDTLPCFPADRAISILRMDGDWYQSTRCILRNLFAYVIPGGLIIVDDYFDWEGCARALHEYLGEIKAPERIREAEAGDFAYIVKEPPG
ncbi:MAG TPA: TylF/MycF/NovP-related O-methyltransferase [Stellaceae bacterium]|nr:TylF/MycF/NovP-related O-methyltransferase [Stellaceae bacterium]